MPFRFLRRWLQKRTSDPQEVGIYLGRYGDRPGIPPTPLLIYGHAADGLAKTIAGHSSVTCLAVQGLDNLAKVLESSDFIGLMAMSPENAPGEAGKAISLFQARHPDTMTLYRAWSYNVASVARRAKEYQTHGVILPGADVNELLNYIFEMGRRADSGLPSPATTEEYEQQIREFFTEKSPFWKLQEQPDRPCY